MTIKEMPHVTCEQILALRDAAIKLEEQNHKLKTRLRAMQECARESQGENWLSDWKDDDNNPLNRMEQLFLFAHADHSDVLGEE